tara:strand:- start:456 stop:896 length:441 start_codon:yes stop_codon:yes gene_type:complete
MAFTDLFKLEDTVFKLPGLYFLWTLLFVSNFISLLVDDSTGVHRDFNIISNIFSVIYGCVASVNNIYGNMLPSTMLLISGPVHQYSFWMLFAYFGGADVLTNSAVGVMNYISVCVVSIFSIDMIAKTWYTSFFPQEYKNYVLEQTQ